MINKQFHDKINKIIICVYLNEILNEILTVSTHNKSFHCKTNLAFEVKYLDLYCKLKQCTLKVP